jgi:hypothetical protein
MEISTTFTTTPRTVIQSYRACHWASYGLNWVVGIVLIADGVVAGSIPSIVVGFAVVALTELGIRRQLRRYRSGKRSVTLTITEDEYRTRGPDSSTARPWTAFKRVRRIGKFWVLRLSATKAMALPADALDAAQTQQFTALMRQVLS